MILLIQFDYFLYSFAYLQNWTEIEVMIWGLIKVIGPNE